MSSPTDAPRSSPAPVTVAPPDATLAGHPSPAVRPDGAAATAGAPPAAAAPRAERLTAAARPYALAAYRIVAGGLFASHGAASLFGVLGGAAGTGGGTVPEYTWPGWYAALLQFGCGLLVLTGCGTRVFALLASGSMAYAYFTVHQPAALWPLQNGGEPAALFCWAFFLLVFTGPGALSVDGVLSGTVRRRRATATP